MFKNFRLYPFLIALALAPILYGCSSDSDNPVPVDETQEKYTVWLQIGSWPNTTQYILGTNSLTEGSIDLTGHGAEVTGKSAYGIITKGGYYYYYNTTTGRFSKFKYEKELYNTVLEVPYTHMADISGFTWINDHTLFVVGTDGDQAKVHYSVIETETLKITNGVLDTPAIPAGFKYFNLGNVEYTNGKVFVQFGFTADRPTPWENKVNIGVVDYATLKYEKTLQSAVSAGPGTNKLWLSSSFVDDSGNTYFATNVEWSNLTQKQTAIYRIKKGATELDASYTVNASTVGYNGVGLWYIGGTKAIFKYIDPAVTGSAHIYAFAVFDLETGKITRKLTEIPNDADAYIQNIIVEDGKVFMITNAETGKDYVYIYDIAAQTVKTGMEMVGGYDWILRLDKMR
ncbi:hypothetical protein DYBT9275_03140 [Dyadobacter sp. CECT 9275]|uniref:DUF4374 domain-containing protein n=1 Tax=Dyadobacter helix TaxID=2822344 RepID=A0A916JCR5_9BACT|nr:DUF4374 domain-containing protein [Dyadobacter sp. CECT 9275]CAG5003386.1 hypothetical protein DYBT9275_03140 [Dyadobacter sp. CECT 9275]